MASAWSVLQLGFCCYQISDPLLHVGSLPDKDEMATHALKQLAEGTGSIVPPCRFYMFVTHSVPNPARLNLSPPQPLPPPRTAFKPFAAEAFSSSDGCIRWACNTQRVEPRRSTTGLAPGPKGFRVKGLGFRV